jgi:hypothetical protein
MGKGRKSLSYEEVKKYIESQNYTLLSVKYDGNLIPLEMKCPKGHIVNIRWNDFKNKGTRCHVCYDLSRRLQIGENDYIEKYKYYKEYIESFGYKMLSEQVFNQTEKILIECPKGHKFYKSFNNFKAGQRCRICSRSILSYEEVKYNIEITGYKLLSKEYKNNYTSLEVECPNGHRYRVKYYNFQDGKRCPECASNSKGEDLINTKLKDSELIYSRQYRIDECRNKNPLPFDFGIFNNENNLICLIEYQGIQHFKPIKYFGGLEGFEYRKENDNIKSTYCKDKNINLFLISYLDIKNIEEIINNIIEFSKTRAV